jgi:hypothetical protein
LARAGRAALASTTALGGEARGRPSDGRRDGRHGADMGVGAFEAYVAGGDRISRL